MKEGATEAKGAERVMQKAEKVDSATKYSATQYSALGNAMALALALALAVDTSRRTNERSQPTYSGMY